MNAIRRAPHLTVFALGLALTAGCSLIPSSSSDLPDEVNYAIAACGLTKLNGDSSSGGEQRWSAPDLVAKSSFFFDDPLPELTAIRDDWSAAAPQASAAAQIDAAYLQLSTAITKMLSFMNALLSYRDRSASAYEFSQQYSAEMYNGPLDTWRSECAGLSTRLNSE